MSTFRCGSNALVKTCVTPAVLAGEHRHGLSGFMSWCHKRVTPTDSGYKENGPGPGALIAVIKKNAPVVLGFDSGYNGTPRRFFGF